MSGLGLRAGPIVLIVLMGALYLPWTWSDQLASLGGDSAVYLLSARDYAPTLPPDPVVKSIADNSQFPPLYPALLAVTGAATDLRIAHAVTTLCLLAAFAAFYASLLSLGLSQGLALATTAIFAVLPGTVQQALQLKSEGLYLALTLGGLTALSRASAKQRPGPYWVASGLLAAALLTRSAGIAVLPALLMVLVRCRPRGWYWMPAVVLLPSLAWTLLRQPEQGYGHVLAAYGQAPAAAVVRQLAANAQSVAWGFAANVLQTTTLLWAMIPLSLAAGAVLAWRFCRWQADAWYLAAYLALIVVWPYPSEAQRFCWVVLPWLLGYTVWAAVWAAARVGAGPVAHGIRGTGVAVLALLVAPSVAITAQRWFHPAVQANPALVHLPEWYGADPGVARAEAELHLEMVRAIQQLGTRVPEGECLYSIKPATVTFYTARESFGPPFDEVDDAAFAGAFDAPRCRYVLLLAATQPPQFPEAYYPKERLGERLEIIEARGSGYDASGRVVAALGKLVDLR